MPTAGGGIPFPVVIVAVFLIFYFIYIRPEKKRQQEIQQMKNNLKKNDQVISLGGIHGVVSLVKDKTVVVRVDDNVKIEFEKDSIVSVVKAKENE
ncbi:MAG: preprotein translocase subunit YajC [Candidatus Omnitrophica bacterium]|nr:preprotein translocase subunit YajC [Candidatus Omnitrophota bacterium]